MANEILPNLNSFINLLPKTGAVETFNQAQQKIKDANNKLNEAKVKVKQAQDKVEDAKKKIEEKKALAEQQKKRLAELKKRRQETIDNFTKINTDTASILKGQMGINIKKQLMSMAVPILISLIRKINIADTIINKIENDTKKQLQDKGVLVISGGSFVFTPSNLGNYNIYKTNFDNRVSNLKAVISDIISILTFLDSIIKIINYALTAFQLFKAAKAIVIQIKLASVTADLGTPSPVKPSGRVLKSVIDDILKELNMLPPGREAQSIDDKIKDFQDIINAIQMFLRIFKGSLNDIKIRLDELSFTIVGIDSELPSSLQAAKNASNDDSEYISINGTKYILKYIELPNRYKQYQALDAFSKLKISQTAPSIIKTPNELLEEIKQILG